MHQLEKRFKENVSKNLAYTCRLKDKLVMTGTPLNWPGLNNVEALA